MTIASIESFTTSIQQKWETAEALFCACNQPKTWEYATMDETDIENYPYDFDNDSNDYDYDGEEPVNMIVFDKLGFGKQQQQQQQRYPLKKSQPLQDLSVSTNNRIRSNDESVFRGEIHSSSSIDTCTTATMHSMSFDAWDEIDEDIHNNNSGSIIIKEVNDDDEDDDDDDSVIIGLRRIPELALSQQIFSNDSRCSISIYASPALAYDDESDDENSITDKNGDDEDFMGIDGDDSQWLKRANAL